MSDLQKKVVGHPHQATGEPLNDSEIPEVFNSHLGGVGKRLSEKFKNSDPLSRETSSDESCVFQFGDVLTHEVLTLVKGIKTYKSSAVSELSSRILKDSFLCLIPQLTFLFNCSLSTGNFPLMWKKANVVLLHKGGSKLDVNNYRPISLLPLPGKLLESIIHVRLLFYIL